MGISGETADRLAFIRWAQEWPNPSTMQLPDGGTFPETIQTLATNLASTISELWRSGQPATTDLARIETWRGALATALQTEAFTCRNRFSTSSDLGDIALTIAYRQATLDATVPGTSEFAERQVDLALDLRARHAIDPGDKSALDRALAMVASAQVFLTRPETSASKPAPWSHASSASFRATEALADLLGERFEGRSDALDLDRAIEVAPAARELESGDRSASAAADNRVALLLRLQHDNRGDHADLDLDIAHVEAFISGTDRVYPVRLGNLGLRLATRFNLSGNAADLDRSIDLTRTGLSIWRRVTSRAATSAWKHRNPPQDPPQPRCGPGGPRCVH